MSCRFGGLFCDFFRRRGANERGTQQRDYLHDQLLEVLTRDWCTAQGDHGKKGYGWPGVKVGLTGSPRYPCLCGETWWDSLGADLPKPSAVSALDYCGVSEWWDEKTRRTRSQGWGKGWGGRGMGRRVKTRLTRGGVLLAVLDVKLFSISYLLSQFLCVGLFFFSPPPPHPPSLSLFFSRMRARAHTHTHTHTHANTHTHTHTRTHTRTHARTHIYIHRHCVFCVCVSLAVLSVLNVKMFYDWIGEEGTARS